MASCGLENLQGPGMTLWDRFGNGVVKRNKGIFLDGTRDEVYNLACKYLFSKNVQLCAKSMQAVELINSFLKGVAEPYD